MDYATLCQQCHLNAKREANPTARFVSEYMSLIYYLRLKNNMLGETEPALIGMLKNDYSMKMQYMEKVEADENLKSAWLAVTVVKWEDMVDFWVESRTHAAVGEYAEVLEYSYRTLAGFMDLIV